MSTWLAMRSRAIVGELSEEIGGEMACRIEWTIKDIYTLKEQLYDSPVVSISNCNWFLKLGIHPFSMADPNATAWISLHLHKQKVPGAPTSAKGASFSLGVLRPDGAIEKRVEDIWIFDEGCSGYGLPRFLKRTDLLQRKLELAPTGHLTVTCCLDVTDDTSCPTSMDTLSSDLADLFNSKLGCDALLKVQHQEIPVHKCILSARSPVFAAMFESDMREGQTGIVDIADCEPGVFEDFLAYVYTGKFQNTSENVWELYRVADKYCVKKLRSACVLYVMGRLSLETVCEAASLAEAYGEYGLQEKSQSFFDVHFGEIICTPSWELLLATNMHLANDLLKRMVARQSRAMALNFIVPGSK